MYRSANYTKVMAVKLAGAKIPGITDLRRPPREMWCEGNWDPSLTEKAAAVVGSRRVSDYGRRVVEKLVPALVSSGQTIVSGFMYGVDQAAHRAAVECGGKTIAVLGWGMKEALFGEEKKLAREIVSSGGVLLSEWEWQAATRWTFPLRNRIVAAISQEIFVVEAAQKSGALLTADYGIKLGRKLWAVPGPVTSAVSRGTNRLIADGLAKMWLPESFQTGRYINDTVRSSNYADIYTVLQNEILDTDELAKRLNKSARETGARLQVMVLEGVVETRDGKFWLKE